MNFPNLYVRIAWENGVVVGPEQIRLLEAVRDTGSICAATKLLGLSYTHIWRTFVGMNACLCHPVIASDNKGTHLTPFGRRLIRQFRQLEATANAANTVDLWGFWSGLPAEASDRRPIVRAPIS
jgi:molybdate transport repressor ModE-like protein